MHYNSGHFGTVMVHPVGRFHSAPFHVQSLQYASLLQLMFIIVTRPISLLLAK